MHRSVRWLGAGAAALLATTTLTQAQDAAELQELRDRINTLEAQQAALEAQQADTTAPDGFVLRTVAALEDTDQIKGREGLGRLSFALSDTTTVSVYGFVRAEAFYDFDFAQGDLSRAGRVGAPGFATDGEFDTSVRVSRFGIRSNSETDFGTIKTQLEFDLFGSGGDESTSPNLRLRHANVNINDTYLIGQFWSNFMPLVHYPSTVDFNGPVGITFARVPQLRYTFNNGNGFQFSTSIEEAAGGSSDPVITAAALYSTDNWSVRLAGLAGSFNSGGQEFDTNGITLSGSISPWEGGSFSASYTTGEALGNLLIGGGARAVGGVTNDSDSFTLAFRQEVTEKLAIGIAYGNEEYDLATQTFDAGGVETGLPGGFTDLESLHVSAFYTPVENLTLGLEYIRIESSGPTATAAADRIGASITMRF